MNFLKSITIDGCRSIFTIAAEAHYHTSCYKNYTRVIKKASKDDDERVSEDDTYQIVERQVLLIVLSIFELLSFQTRKLCLLVL